VLPLVDIHDLLKSGFVSTSDFLDLVWGKVRSNCFNGVQRIISLKNLTPFHKDFFSEEKECGSFFDVYKK
jgi:hypothetical protein